MPGDNEVDEENNVLVTDDQDTEILDKSVEEREINAIMKRCPLADQSRRACTGSFRHFQKEPDYLSMEMTKYTSVNRKVVLRLTHPELPFFKAIVSCSLIYHK